jgi:hypothetical protein
MKKISAWVIVWGIVATNLPPYAEAIGAGAFVIGLLIAIYDFASCSQSRLPALSPIAAE